MSAPIGPGQALYGCLQETLRAGGGPGAQTPWVALRLNAREGTHSAPDWSVHSVNCNESGTWTAYGRYRR